MKKGIIHISDLHITQHHDEDGNVINLSWFVAEPVTFKEKIIEVIKRKKEDLKIKELLLIVSGDLSNQSTEEEYKHTNAFLNSLIKELDIKAENILIVPGNHDINWLNNQVACTEGKKVGSKKKSWEYQLEKFKYFKIFYEDFFKEDGFLFDSEKNVVHHLVLEDEKIFVIGLNSVLKSSHIEKRYGDFELSQLDEELRILLDGYDEYVKIAIFHHNPIFNSSANEPTFKSWTNTNVIFNKFDIKTFLFGHEHTYGATTDDSDFSNYISTGSLGIKKSEINNYINIVEFLEDCSSLKLKCHFLKLEPPTKNHPPFGFWNDLKDPAMNKELLLRKKEAIEPSAPSSILPKTINTPISQIVTCVVDPKSTIVDVVKSDYSDKMVEYVKQRNVFKTGHFHWSDNAKAHNWLDIPCLLNNREISLICQKAIIDLIANNNIQSELIIGIGMEGCFLGSVAAMQFSLPFTFVPYEYRYKDHDTYETKLNHDTVKTVTIVTDVVHSGNTIKRLLDYEKEFFNSSEVINIISLFYTGSGKKEYKVDMFSEINQKLKFYNVCDKIRVESCPYGNDFATKCIVYEKKLDTVYEFYSKEKNK